MKDDGSTTVDNLTIAPEGGEEILAFGGGEPPELFKAPVDEGTGREYFQMSSGEMLVIDPLKTLEKGMDGSMIVGGVANGKWFWDAHEDDNGMKQLIVWHESVEGQSEYQVPCSLTEKKYCDIVNSARAKNARRHKSFATIRREWEAANKRVNAVIELTHIAQDAKERLLAFLACDPLSRNLLKAKLPDGFLAHVYDNGRGISFGGVFDAQRYRDSSLLPPEPTLPVFLPNAPFCRKAAM